MSTQDSNTTKRPDHLVVAEPPATGNIDLSATGITGDFAVIDVETTGLDAEVDQIVEIAVARMRDGQLEFFSSLVNPGFPIPPTSMAVHHITDEMVATAPKIADLAPELHRLLDGAVPIAHNADLDATFVDRVLGVPVDPTGWLCTYRAARHLMPLAPAFGNQVLRYWLKTQPRTEGLGAHRAMDDVHVTLENLGHVMALAAERGIKTMEQLRELSQSLIPVETMPFGKHAGKKIEEIPADYFEWALKNMTNLDRDMRATMERQLSGSSAGAANAAGARQGQTGQQQDGSAQGGAPREPRIPRMPFGAHKGKPLTEVPGDYLKWLLGTNLREQLQQEVSDELAARMRAENRQGNRQESRQESPATGTARPAGAQDKPTPAAAAAPAASGAAPRGAAGGGGNVGNGGYAPRVAQQPTESRRGNFFRTGAGVVDLFGGDDMQAPSDDEPEPETASMAQAAAPRAAARPRP